MLKRREFVKIAAAIAITAALPRLARAAAPVAAKLDDAAKADVARIVAYLNGIHTLESHIEQVAADGIYYWDSKLEQLSETRVEDTPAWFLLRPDIKAVGDVTVTKFDRQPGVLRMTMVETRHADLGSVTLTLTDNPMQLRQWTVVDAQARPVTVTLTDPRFGMAISPLMFQWIDPRMTKGRIPG